MSTLTTGLFSYVAFFVAARGMSTGDASTFISWWAIVNTFVLALTIPLDTYAPRMRLDCESLRIPDSDRRRLLDIYASVVGALTLLVVVGLSLLDLVDISPVEALGVGLFGVSVSLTGGRRASLVAESRFGRFLLLSVVASAIGTTFLLALFLGRPISVAEGFLASSSGGFIGWIMTTRRRKDRTGGGLAESWHRLRDTGPIRVLGRLSISTLVALMLSNGAVIIGKSLGVDGEDLVVYAAAVNIVLIPFTLLNTLTAPIHNRVIDALRFGDHGRIRDLYRRSLTSYLVVVVTVAIVAYFCLPFVVRIYIGEEYSLGSFAGMFVCFGEGLATVIALPRVFIVALERTAGLTRLWAAGFVAFIVTMLIPVPVLVRMIAAPVVASSLILIIAQFKFVLRADDESSSKT
jgi:O-antigen/teichoic acid export membrane protein